MPNPKLNLSLNLQTTHWRCEDQTKCPHKDGFESKYGHTTMESHGHTHTQTHSLHHTPPASHTLHLPTLHRATNAWMEANMSEEEKRAGIRHRYLIPEAWQQADVFSCHRKNHHRPAGRQAGRYRGQAGKWIRQQQRHLILKQTTD